MPIIEFSLKNEYKWSEFVNRFRGIMVHSDDEAMRVLVREMNSEDAKRRLIAAQLAGMARMFKDLSGHRPGINFALRLMVRESDDLSISRASTLFSFLGEDAMHSVIALNQRSDERGQQRALRLLGGMTTVPEQDIQVTVSRLREGSSRVQQAALYAVRDALPDDPEILDSVLNLLDASATQAATIKTLDHLGPAAGIAVAPRTRLLEHQNHETRLAAARAIWSINRDAKAILPTLIALLGEDHEDKVVKQTCYLLSSMKASAKPATAALRRLENRPNVRNLETLTLRGINLFRVAEDEIRDHSNGSIASVRYTVYPSDLKNHRAGGPRVGIEYRLADCQASWRVAVLDR